MGWYVLLALIGLVVSLLVTGGINLAATGEFRLAWGPGIAGMLSVGFGLYFGDRLRAHQQRRDSNPSS